MSSHPITDRGSVVSFTIISLAMMTATLLALVQTSGRLFDAQIAQLAADASALACAMKDDDQNHSELRERAEELASKNGGELFGLEIKTDRCVVVVATSSVLRRSVAVSISHNAVPTLQR
ncbi:MAG: hypothetical protein FJW19_03780 [Actinobacteria bacterium]|nr:hypothetical protein [Actinomycetota bacterium]